LFDEHSEFGDFKIYCPRNEIEKQFLEMKGGSYQEFSVTEQSRFNTLANNEVDIDSNMIINENNVYIVD
jgi:hypothetical protein